MPASRKRKRKALLKRECPCCSAILSEKTIERHLGGKHLPTRIQVTHSQTYSSSHNRRRPQSLSASDSGNDLSTDISSGSSISSDIKFTLSLTILLTLTTLTLSQSLSALTQDPKLAQTNIYSTLMLYLRQAQTQRKTMY